MAGHRGPPRPAGVGGCGYGQRSQVLQVLESQAEELGSCPRPVGSRGRVLSRGRTGSGLKVPLAAEWGEVEGGRPGRRWGVSSCRMRTGLNLSQAHGGWDGVAGHISA